MNDFILYFKMGLNHVLDFSAYDHILFLIVLAVVFSFNQFKKVLWLVTLFTIGHTLTLFLSAYDLLFEMNKKNTEIVEFLIPFTIFVTGVVNVFTAKKSSAGKQNTNLVFAVFFGLIHGLGFSSYISRLVSGDDNKLLILSEFALGIEAAQIIIVLGILVIGTLLQNFINVTKRDWILVCSSIVVGFSIQMMLNRVFW
ncbi:HupE/UreJ family protein [Polaribacter sp. SA4-12]|uniref:HupE/UreJ family protein n=1 Tax=Polaribacter sp. SA4-12 TaxID=1312072 RepID=UPI000B3C3DEF|nr:HupE/UreJ family protein [Polaribacter sp. SA4-12]ARV16901.1 HupE / UreJ protein [Polaribacter sp. SA4-12]